MTEKGRARLVALALAGVAAGAALPVTWPSLAMVPALALALAYAPGALALTANHSGYRLVYRYADFAFFRWEGAR